MEIRQAIDEISCAVNKLTNGKLKASAIYVGLMDSLIRWAYAMFLPKDVVLKNIANMYDNFVKGMPEHVRAYHDEHARNVGYKDAHDAEEHARRALEADSTAEFTVRDEFNTN